MRQTTGTRKSAGEKIIKDIKRATRTQYSSEQKIKIVLDGLRGEDSIAELCRREGISQGVYYKWSKDFMEAGKKRLAGDTARAATTDEVKDLRRQARDLKEVVAEQTLELRLLKKHGRGWGRPRMRYATSDKLEIIRLVEGSHLSARRTLAKLGWMILTARVWASRSIFLCQPNGLFAASIGSSNGVENQKLFGLILAPNISVASCRNGLTNKVLPSSTSNPESRSRTPTLSAKTAQSGTNGSTNTSLKT